MIIQLSTFIGMILVPVITGALISSKYGTPSGIATIFVMFLICMTIAAFILGHPDLKDDKYERRVKAEKAARKAEWAFQDVAAAQAQTSAKYTDMHFSEHDIKRLAKLLFFGWSECARTDSELTLVRGKKTKVIQVSEDQ